MASQSEKQTIAIHILLYISRSKDNQTMKFGQLIEYNMRNIFICFFSLVFTSYKGFLENKNRSENSLSALFCVRNN